MICSIVLICFFSSCLFAAFPVWQRLETEHTTIIFEERDSAYAFHVASFADETFEELSLLLNHSPKRKVPVILAGRTSFSNGYYSPFPSSLVLFITSPVDRFLGGRTSDWLKSLYTHELTHYLHLTAPVGPAKYLRIFGPEVPAMNTLLMPLWWMEGITTYTETAYAQGGRGDSSLFALTWQAPLLQESMWSLSQGRYSSSFPPSGRSYSTGYLMVDYLMRNYPQESFTRINEHFTWFPFFGLSHAIKKETGLTGKELFALALEEQRALLSKNSSMGTLFSPDEFGDYYLVTPTKNGLLGFTYTPDQGGAVVDYQEDGIPKLVSRIPVYDRESLAIGSTFSVFSFLSSDETHPASLPLAPNSYSDLYRYDMEHDTFTQLTFKQILSHPALDSDENRLVAIQRIGDRHRLVEIDLQNGAIEILYEPAEGSVFEPQLAHDGSFLVAVLEEGGNSSLLFIKEGEAPLVLLGPTSSELRSPRIIDDDTIFFVSDHDGGFALYRYTLSTDLVEKLLDDPQGVLGSVIEGDVLYYQTYTSKGYAVKKIPVAMLQPSFVQMNPSRIQTQTIQENTSFTVSRYIDHPRLNIILPFPFVQDNAFEPGVYVHMKSLLGKQSLIGQIGWSFEQEQVLSSMEYLYNPGPFSLVLDLKLGSTDSFETTLTLPLVNKTRIDGFSQVLLVPTIGYARSDNTTNASISLSLGYARSERTTPKDYFGAPFFSFSAGAQAIAYHGFDIFRYLAFGNAAYQGRILGTHQMLQFQLSLASINEGNLGQVLLLDGSFPSKGDGEAKARLSFRYHLPLGLFDEPIPYGGFTGLGLSLSAQSVLYLDDSRFVWKDELVLSARLTSTLVFGGASSSVKPFVMLSYSLYDQLFRFSLGLNGEQLVSAFRPSVLGE